MTSDDFYLHSLLCYNQRAIALGHCCPLIWDLRESPETARRVVNPDQAITSFYLSRLATYPPTAILNITSDIFNHIGDSSEEQQWPIQVRRLEGITIGDVLDAIHTTLMHPIRREEWDQLSEKHRGRIDVVFEERCKTAASPADSDLCRSRGILRVDCLLRHTIFAGLTVSLVKDCSCILTLRRPPRYIAVPNSVET